MQVFISHASADKVLAGKIRDLLQHQNINVKLDEADIRVGQSIPPEIQSALQASDVICIILSSASANSMWVARELESFLPLLVDASRDLVPCLIDSAQVPQLIKDIKYADFTNSFDIGVDELLDAVKIREQIINKKRLEDLCDRISYELSSEELLFFLKWTTDAEIYIEYNEEKDCLDAPQELEKLTRLGLVRQYGTCRADVWYCLSDDGKAIKILMDAVQASSIK